MTGARGTNLGKGGTPARPEQYDVCACGGPKRIIAVVCRSCYLTTLPHPKPHRILVPTTTLRELLNHLALRPLSRELSRATGKPPETWERWLVRAKKQSGVSPRILDQFASALDLHVSMFEESA